MSLDIDLDDAIGLDTPAPGNLPIPFGDDDDEEDDEIEGDPDWVP